MKNLHYKYLIILVIALLFFSSCTENTKVSEKTEGIIKYKITYLKDSKENPIVALLPKYTNMKFKDNLMQFNMKGWMGVFESKLIKDTNKKSIIVALKMMNKKIYCQSSEISQFMGLNCSDDEVKITFDDKTKQILDYNCKHAVVHNMRANTSFDLYYTDEIGAENPNADTIYEPIKGILMEMQMEINGIPMQLVASEIKHKKISETDFTIPNDYTLVKKNMLDSLLTSVM